MIDQPPQFLKGFLLGLPVWGILGWLANRLFSPTFDEFGMRLKVWFMLQFDKNEYKTYIAYSNLQKMLSALHAKGHNFFNDKKPYLNNHDINLQIKSKTKGQLQNVANVWIHQARIGSYAESDVFFAAMELLLHYLSKTSIEDIFNRHKDNSQAALWVFLEIVEEKRPDLLTADILQYLRAKQKEWNSRLEKRRQKTGAI